jgi:hypothetical protein
MTVPRKAPENIWAPLGERLKCGGTAHVSYIYHISGENQRTSSQKQISVRPVLSIFRPLVNEREGTAALAIAIAEKILPLNSG